MKLRVTYIVNLSSYLVHANSLIGPWKTTGVAVWNGFITDHPSWTKLWAPDVHYEPESNKYHMYYAISTRGSHDSIIGAASSPDMTPGSSTDHGAILHSIVNSRYNAINANWVSVKAKPYLNFASNLAYNGTASHHIEAPFMFQHNDWYYLLFSSVVMCRSKSSHGHFVDKVGEACLKCGGTTLLASHDHIYGPGGQDIFEGKQYGHVLYYRYAGISIGLSRFQY
ncbi:glycosyl hydrolase [Aspergillus spectabilis]